MKIAKWGNSLAVRLSAAVVDGLPLEEGDEVAIVEVEDFCLGLARRPDREALIKSFREFRGALPAGYKFDRDEAHER